MGEGGAGQIDGWTDKWMDVQAEASPSGLSSVALSPRAALILRVRTLLNCMLWAECVGWAMHVGLEGWTGPPAAPGRLLRLAAPHVPPLPLPQAAIEAHTVLRGDVAIHSLQLPGHEAGAAVQAMAACCPQPLFPSLLHRDQARRATALRGPFPLCPAPP